MHDDQRQKNYILASLVRDENDDTFDTHVPL